MVSNISQEEVYKIINNLHNDPFSVLGSHLEENKNGQKSWIVRTYLPEVTSVSVIYYEKNRKKECSMSSLYHPHFFECRIEIPELVNYQLKILQEETEKIIYDPYSFHYSQITELDLHLFAEGNHYRIYEKLGAHITEINGIKGVFFAVWAPNARNVSVLGDFNNWDGRFHQMRKLQDSIWDLFIPEIGEGTIYKYEIKNQQGHIYDKIDPYGFQHQLLPYPVSVIVDLDKYKWEDSDWLEKRRKTEPLDQPISIYEVHLGSWLHGSVDDKTPLLSGEIESKPLSDWKPDARFLSYYELADKLIDYVKKLGYTHIELLPIVEHPYEGSWGYQVISYYGPTSRYGNPEDLMYLIDKCHQNGIGVIMDWVPAHFAKDKYGLAYFDGTCLYEYEDPRRGEQKEWGTLVFNYSSKEVCNFLISNALFWLDKYHIDGIRVDAVASMLYLDYGRKEGEWIPNEYGGRENFEAADFLRHLNSVIFNYYPGILSIAEESTTWPMVSWPTYVGGLGFNLKWNLGWMHDILDYFHMDFWNRQYHQNNITFSMWYHYNENYMLVLSHDEVVHGKSSILGKMSGDEWQKFANVRCLFSYMFCHPGKKTMFMSMELGQWSEWNVGTDIEWHLLQYERHEKLGKFFTDLNNLYKKEPALYNQDFDKKGFEWIDCNDNRHSIVSFIRRSKDLEDFVVVVCNFTPQPHSHYRIGVPESGFYTELFNSDARPYGGSNMGNLGGKWTVDWWFHNRPYSLDLCLPPLGVLILKLDRNKKPEVIES